MATNTSALKTFAQQTRAKLISLITTKMQFVLNGDTAELRGYEREISELRKQIAEKTEKIVIEEVAYTWFNRVMALRFMDANSYNAPMVVTPAEGQVRPEILQDAMGGSIDDALMLTAEEKVLPEAKLYRKLLVAVCNNQMSQPMPFLFEHISDFTELLLPDDLLSDQSFVTDIRRGMTDEDCQNVELMGWLYQFYITDRKADAETKKSKKGGLKSDEQAAATQLFTPHWIVRYMVENSLGRIWMTLHPDSHLLEAMPYYIHAPEGQTDTIPEDIHSAKDIRFLDPCMGSGHILVYAFDLFTKMYEEEGEQAKDIPTLILENNLFGIDIDRRCYQLASFALTMKARAYYRRYLRHTVNPNVISLEKIDRDTIDSAGTWGQKSLMWQFENIDTIGSLLKVTPEECAAIHVEENSLFGVKQKLLKTQAGYLSGKYHCVVTNPPYLGKGFCDELTDFVNLEFPNSKTDLYSAFIEHLSSIPCENGYTAMVTMESWMFLPSHKKLRKYIVDHKYILNLAHFDWHIMRIAFGTAAFIMQNVESGNKKGVYSYLDRKDVDLNKELPYCFPIKTNGRFSIKDQSDFKKIPDYTICYWIGGATLNCYSANNISNYAKSAKGMMPGSKYIRVNWEVCRNNVETTVKTHEESKLSDKKWYLYFKGGQLRRWYGNHDFAVDYQHDGERVKAGDRNPNLYFKKNINWSKISSGLFSARSGIDGCLYDDAACQCKVNEEYNYYYILALLNTKVAQHFLWCKSQTFNYVPGEVSTIPALLKSVNDLSVVAKENVSISKQDWDSHETSWDFQRSPLWEQQLDIILDEMRKRGIFSEDATIGDIGPFNLPDLLQPIEILVENYKSMWEDLFYKLHHNEEELNRKFIEIYGLQDELTPDVPLDEITILQKGEIIIEDNKIVWHDDVIIKQFISYLVGCLMGRYSVDKPGLIIASQGQKVTGLDLPAHTIEIDDDGIIPVIMEEEFFADDLTQRIETSVKTLFGERNFYENMKFIKSALGMNLRDYLYKDYYIDHQQMYSVKINGANAKRPIYWLFSSQMGEKKKRGHFKALVYMHRLESDTLSKLHADYVHPYLTKVEQQLREAEDNATRDDLSQAQHNKALKLAEELKEKVREVKAFETQLVEMASARITIDLDDGVKANYPKFYPLVEPIKGLDTKDE
jgi:hypothetical protein